LPSKWRCCVKSLTQRGLPYLASPMEPFDLIAENHAFHREALANEAVARGLPVPVMRTVFVADSPRAAEDALAAHASEQRLPRGMKLPPAMQRAAAAPPRIRACSQAVSSQADSGITAGAGQLVRPARAAARS